MNRDKLLKLILSRKEPGILLQWPTRLGKSKVALDPLGSH